jgi:hypothetical protein
MKLWIDDVRPTPEGYDCWCKSVNEAKNFILSQERRRDDALKIAEFNLHQRHDIIAYRGALRIAGNRDIELIDIDHDAGDYASDGGDYIRLLDWLEETGRNYPIRIHSANPVGVANMRRIIEKNGWKEIR